MEKRKETFTEATAAELTQPVSWPPTVPQRSYLCKTYSRLAWHEHVALIFSQCGSASRSAYPDTPHHSGCPGALRARLVKMDSKGHRLQLGPLSPPVCCKQPPHRTGKCLALGPWMQGLRQPLRNMGEGKRLGEQSLRKGGSLSPRPAELSSVNKFTDPLIE